MRKLVYLLAAVAMLVLLAGMPVMAAGPDGNSGSLLPSGNVYQKLINREPVRIAILGDSIACPLKDDVKNSWYSLLTEWLRTQYQTEVTLDNYAGSRYLLVKLI